MEEHLTIRNFGPIREADVVLRDLTIFVGPQATGKSLTAQALYFLRGIEDLLLSSSPESNRPSEVVLSALEWWLGNDPAVYAGPGTVLEWKSSLQLPPEKQAIRWNARGQTLSGALKKRVLAWQGKKRASPKHQVYIPAGRTLYSFVTTGSALRFKSSEDWPGHILAFYELLDKAVEGLWRKEESQFALFSQTSSLKRQGGAKRGPSEWLPQLEQQIQLILKGHIEYGPGAIVLETGKVRLRPVNIAAGQMEIWPFWAIVESGIRSHTIFYGSQIYFEEPEAHLHPGAQRGVMEMVAFLVRRGVRVLITTHSPYILYAVNNFLMAHKVLEAKRTLPEDVSTEAALRPDQVSAYRFSQDGIAHNIMDAEVGLIDEDELDRVADDLGATFTRLQDCLGEAV